MPKYRVTVTFPVFVTCEVEAENEDEAREEGSFLPSLTSYVGNGGCNKLVGPTDSEMSIEPGDIPLEGGKWEADVEEVEE